MRCKCKLFNVAGIPASDGSIIPREVVEQYLTTDKYKNDVESRNMLGTLTHRARNLANAPVEAGAALKKTIGKDDMLLLVGVSSPTHYIERLYVENDGWCYADIKILDEDGLDDDAVQNIRRIKGLLKQGIKPGVSAVISGYWQESPGGTSCLKKIQRISALDFTVCPSWKDSQITEIYDDSGEKMFSEVPDEDLRPSDFQFDGVVKVKQFSNLDSFGLSGLPKSSKIDGQYTMLKVKQFSANGVVEELNEENKENSVIEEKSFSAATVKERVRFAKLSPRQRFRMLVMDYRQAIRQSGGIGKIDEETLRVMKSLFSSDLLDIMKTITPEIISGKNINTLLGASSLGKGPRKAVQALQVPFRLAMQESAKQGFVSKARYQAIQAAYIDFVNSLVDDVFGQTATIEDDNKDENLENKKEA